MRRAERRRRLVIATLVALCLVLLGLDRAADAGGGQFSEARDVAGSAFGPVEHGFDRVVNPVGDFLSGLPDVGSSQRTIDRLRRENARLRGQLQTRSLSAAQADVLRRIGVLADRRQLRVAETTVLDLGPSLGFEWTARIGIGSANGVRAGMTVIDADGLVGRVKQVGRDSATVLLAADAGSSVGVRVVRTGELGVVTGAGLGPMRYLPLDPKSSIRAGDVLVTGPYGASTYAAGVPLGTVAAVRPGSQTSTPSARVTPSTDYTALDVVAVVLAQRPPTNARASGPARTPGRTR